MKAGQAMFVAAILETKSQFVSFCHNGLLFCYETGVASRLVSSLTQEKTLGLGYCTK